MHGLLRASRSSIIYLCECRTCLMLLGVRVTLVMFGPELWMLGHCFLFLIMVLPAAEDCRVSSPSLFFYGCNFDVGRSTATQ